MMTKIFTERRVEDVVRDMCSCGGGTPDSDCCDACMIWHRLMDQCTPAQLRVWAKRQAGKIHDDNRRAIHWYDWAKEADDGND